LAEAHRFTPGVSGLTQMNSAPATKAACFWFKSGCAELCQNPTDWGPWRSVLSEKQTPQVVVFSRKSLEKGERLDRAFVRPRQMVCYGRPQRTVWLGYLLASLFTDVSQASKPGRSFCCFNVLGSHGREFQT
jgi:hypothetical protein